MPESRKCSSCGAELPNGASSALCPQCFAAAAVSAAPSFTEHEGDTIGRYKLIQEIGVGGFGVVYMAEQAEPVRRRVAVKIVKLGMDTREIIGRFEAERQALALMDHPNIAKVLDAGATASGRPFFVMELVQGERITDYCNKNNLSTRQRLDLFIQVCHAIQHAHQKGIIHRDIKPSNIMVSNPEGATVIKVIDFGIAKAVAQRLTDKTVFTVMDRLIGTPAYMSPEQADMTGRDIDTRSDIYSLGVLLYELLTGRTPFDPSMLVMDGLASIRRTICELEPPSPSMTLNGFKEDVRVNTAKQRNASFTQLVRTVRGDLDWIVMKCLEKDRGRRYETANALAMDIKRHLENETVIAGPPSVAYRFQKAWQRHQAAFAVAAAMALILVAATVVSAWQAVRARRAESLAKERLAESQAITKFLTEVFVSANPNRKGRTVTVVEALGDAAKKLETSLSNQPALRAKLQGTLGATYNGLSLFREAEPLNANARDYFTKASGEGSSDALDAALTLADTYDEINRPEDALKLREQVLEIRRKTLGPEADPTLKAMENVAVSYYTANRTNEALQLREQIMAIDRSRYGPDDEHTLSAMIGLAICYAKAQRTDEAVKMQEQIVAFNRKNYGAESTKTLRATYNLAEYYSTAKGAAEAVRVQEQLQPLLEKVYGPEHTITLRGLQNLSVFYEHAGRKEDAVKADEKLFELSKKSRGPEHPETLTTMNNLGLMYERTGRYEKAIEVQKELERLCAKVYGPDTSDGLWPVANLADSEDQAGQHQDALKLRQHVLEVRNRTLGLTNADTITAIKALASSYREVGLTNDAATLMQKIDVSGP